MHAVVIKVTIDDVEVAERELREDVVPQVSQVPGFVAGYWTRKDDTGLSMVILESEEAANGLSERIRSMAAPAVTVDEVEVREVAAHA